MEGLQGKPQEGILYSMPALTISGEVPLSRWPGQPRAMEIVSTAMGHRRCSGTTHNDQMFLLVYTPYMLDLVVKLCG